MQTCRTDFFSTLKPRLVEHTADVHCCTDFYCGTDGTVFWGGMYQLETRFARIIRYEHSFYVLRSRASRSRWSIPGISGRVDMLTSPAPAARAAVATGAWVESKHDMYVSDTYVEVSVGAQALFLPIRRRLKKAEKRKAQSTKKVPGSWCGTCKHATDYTNQRYGRLSCA